MDTGECDFGLPEEKAEETQPQRLAGKPTGLCRREGFGPALLTPYHNRKVDARQGGRAAKRGIRQPAFLRKSEMKKHTIRL